MTTIQETAIGLTACPDYSQAPEVTAGAPLAKGCGVEPILNPKLRGMSQSATAVHRFAGTVPLPQAACFDGGRLTTEGG
jgi:hypothetical protein